MIQREFDVVVIGTGMAGLTAARIASKEGVKVSVVSRGVGATNMSSGVIDVLGYIPTERGSELLLDPERGIKEFVAKHPEHPYGVMGGGLDASDEERGENAVKVMKDSIQDFKEVSRKTHLEYLGSITENLLVTNFLGTFKPTCLAPSTMYSGDLRKLEDADVMFVGTRSFIDFNPVHVSKSILYLSPTLTKWGVKIKSAKHASIDLPGFDGRKNVLLAEIARALDDNGTARMVSNKLKKIVEEEKPTHLALPIIGMHKAEENLRIMEEATGVKVFEIPSLPPSVAGYRLQTLLETAARNAGVSIARGYDVLQAEVKDGVCESITIQSIVGHKKFEYSAKTFVLATGNLIGGGLVPEARIIKEPLFGLPIVPVEGARPDAFTTWILTEPFPSTGHPVARLGIKVGNHLNPLKEGEVIVKNLYVAGAILSEFDYTSEKSGLGVCLGSGYLAGQNAARYAKEE